MRKDLFCYWKYLCISLASYAGIMLILSLIPAGIQFKFQLSTLIMIASISLIANQKMNMSQRHRTRLGVIGLIVLYPLSVLFQPEPLFVTPSQYALFGLVFILLSCANYLYQTRKQK